MTIRELIELLESWEALHGDLFVEGADGVTLTADSLSLVYGDDDEDEPVAVQIGD